MKELVKKVPGVKKALYGLRKLRGQVLPHEITFTRAFERNEWSDRNSVSGTGSNLEATAVLRRELPALWKRYGIAHLIDAPCGDFYWMRELAYSLEGSYLGLDVVKPIVETNQAAYATEKVRFRQANILTTQLPRADVLLCRDCLVHFSYRDAFQALRNIAESPITYFLTTTFPSHENRDYITGSYWRPVNLQAPPFSFLPPLELLNEGCSEIDNSCADKSLALWRLSEVRQQLLAGR